MLGDRVRVVYRKYDGSLHYHYGLYRLGEDRHGTWLGQPRGGSMRRGDRPAVVVPHAHVMLIPPTGWWTAWFNTEPQWVDVYCDITTRPTGRGRAR